MPLLSFDRQGSGPTLAWLHGFTQTRSSAHQFRTILAGTNELLTLDLPGHGSAATLRATLEETADLLALSLPPEPVALGGYSYGARVALHVAVRHPQRISKLVLLGASRGIEDPSERRARRERDEQLARRVEEIGVERFLDEWLAQPLFAALPHDDLERGARSRDPFGLANSLRSSGTGTQVFLAPALAHLVVPVLAIAGRNDTKFSLEAAAIASGAPHGTCALIDDAGHAAHLEQPERSARTIVSFVNE
jgi:2-succinyl-6-hydroxy-2,4-cyclohexadiene-1-carboxylate synthase